MLRSNWPRADRIVKRKRPLLHPVMRPSGWNPHKSPKRFTGYHTFMGKAERAALVMQLWNE
jgi:hypothetical protein